MNEPGALPPRALPLRPRDRLYAAVTLVLAMLLLPVALVRHPGRTRELACTWALRMRFPAEDLTGLTEGAVAAFTAARTEALWRHGQLIGVTSGYRDPVVQQRLFDEEVRRSGSPASARMVVLPPAESSHVKGIALDVRPTEGARWLEEHGARYDLYRIYDNEWWHFEYRPDCGGTPPPRLAHPGAPVTDRSLNSSAGPVRRHAQPPLDRRLVMSGRGRARTYEPPGPRGLAPRTAGAPTPR